MQECCHGIEEVTGKPAIVAIGALVYGNNFQNTLESKDSLSFFLIFSLFQRWSTFK